MNRPSILIACAALVLVSACERKAEQAPPAAATPTAPPMSGETAAPTEKPLTFTAYGNDFRAVVDQGKLSVEGPAIKARIVAVSEARFAKGTDFTGEGVALTVRSGACKDTAGKDTGMTARLEIDGKTYKGCAIEGAVPAADT